MRLAATVLALQSGLALAIGLAQLPSAAPERVVGKVDLTARQGDEGDGGEQRSEQVVAVHARALCSARATPMRTSNYLKPCAIVFVRDSAPGN